MLSAKCWERYRRFEQWNLTLYASAGRTAEARKPAAPMVAKIAECRARALKWSPDQET